MPANLEFGSTLGSYRIEKLLGKGGMGEVYLAEDQRLKRKVALKILPADVNNDPAYLKRFRREAESAASFHHPNICIIHEIGESDGHTFIAMEYCEGATLQQRIAAGPMELDEVLDIGIQIADALEEARKKKIVHRDIKSSNILLTDRKQVKVLDFGLAKQTVTPDQDLSEASTAAKLTESGIVVGTVAYMSPEQALGKQVDHRSDIFSFGVVLYEMLTGRLPFVGNSTAELLDAILHKQPPSIARYNDKLPDPLIRIISKVLEKDPEERYQSAHEVWVDLRHLKRESSGVASKRDFGTAKLRYSAFGIGIAIAVIIAAVIFLRPAKETPQSPRALSEITSLVALPSKVYGEKEFEYLTDAVPNTISTQLAKLEGLETKMPPTSFEVDQVKGDWNVIAQSYRVKAFVVSSILSEANGFVLNVQLVDAQSRQVLWSNEYKGKREDYVQLARQAADGIRSIVKPESPALIPSVEGAAHSEAELAFQQGKHYSYRYNNRHEKRDFDIAYAVFKRALELDPKMALAAAEIAALHLFQIEAGASPETMVPEIERWAETALKIDPQCGRAWAALSWAELYKANPNNRKRMEYGLDATFYAPKDAMAWTTLGTMLQMASKAQGLVCFRESQRLDPLYLHSRLNVADMLVTLGRANEALPHVEAALSTEPDMSFGLFEKVRALIQLGQAEEAARIVTQLDHHVARGQLPEIMYLLVNYPVTRRQGNARMAEEQLNRILDFMHDTNASFFLTFIWENAVPALAQNGDFDQVIEILKYCSEHGAIPAYDFLVQNRDLDPLRIDPRFQQILSIARRQFDEMLAVLNEAMSRGEFPKFLEKPLADHLKELGYKKTTDGSL